MQQQYWHPREKKFPKFQFHNIGSVFLPTALLFADHGASAGVRAHPHPCPEVHSHPDPVLLGFPPRTPFVFLGFFLDAPCTIGRKAQFKLILTLMVKSVFLGGDF